MKIEIKEPNTIRKRGLEVLNKELGPLGTTCFIRQFDSGEGDYTKEKDELHRDITIKEILSEVRKRNK